MSPLDRIARIELEQSRRRSVGCAENIQLQKNKLKYSHPYDKLFLKLFWNEVLETIKLNSYHNLIFLGGGTGNEAAYIRGRLRREARLVLTDLSYYELRHYKEVFQNYSSPFPDGVLSCSFDELPFSRVANRYCAVAFLSLHHSALIAQIISHMLETFNQIIIFEPMTNRLLQFLSRFGITQRPEEGVAYRPARLSLSFFDSLKSEFDVKIKTYIQIPRDYLPFISHKRQVIFIEESMKIEKKWSRLFFKSQLFLNGFLSYIKFGNMALVHIARKNPV